MDAINNFAQKLEGVPGYDMAVDWINDKAGEKYQTKDPFYVEIHGKKKRRKAPETCSKQEQKSWKRVKKRAWLDDKNFFGCYPIDLGLGLAPLLTLVPVIGPLLMFAIHGRLVSIADQEFHLPPATIAKMHGNIGFDLLISLPPIIGSLFSWMNGCSTRNAAMVHTFLVKRERAKEEERLHQMNVNTEAPDNLSGAHSFQAYQNQRINSNQTSQGTQYKGRSSHQENITQPQQAFTKPQHHQVPPGSPAILQEIPTVLPHSAQQSRKPPPPETYAQNTSNSTDYAQERGRQF